MKKSNSKTTTLRHCLTIGNDKFFGITTEQLQALRTTIHKMIKSESAPVKIEKQEQKDTLLINKTTTFYTAERDDRIKYSVDCDSFFFFDAHELSKQNLIDLGNIISEFLNKYDNLSGNNTTGKLPDIHIKKDKRIFKDDVHAVIKSIDYELGGGVAIYYNLNLNEKVSQNLPFNALIVLMQKINDYFKIIDENK